MASDQLRITVVRKQDGQRVPVIQNSLSVLSPKSPCWPGLLAEEVQSSGPVDNPEVILGEHLLVMHLTPHPVKAEWYMDRQLRQHEYKQGEVSIIPIGARGPGRTDSSVGLFLLTIDNRIVQKAATAMGLKGQVDLPEKIAVDDDLIRGCMTALHSELRAGCPSGQVYGESIGYTLATQLVACHRTDTTRGSAARFAQNTLPAQSLAQVQEYVDANLQNDIGLSDMCAIVYLSPYHFVRVFKSATGMTPHQYLLDRRVVRALELLVSKDLPVREIARLVGFYDQSHLTRHFKRKFGFSPQQFLNRKLR